MDTLRDIHEAAADAIEESATVLAYGQSVDLIGSVFEDTVELYQAYAAGCLLLHYDREAYRRNLVRSGYARLYFLERCRAEGSYGGRFRAISRTEALFNLLVARHDTLVTEFVAASPSDWVRDGEYEDDYCYFVLLHNFASNGEHKSEQIDALINRFEAVVAEEGMPRLAVCRALAARDADEFEAAFDALLVAHEVWAEANEAARAFDPVFHMRTRLFVEGLALLVLAERAGLPTQEEYQFCPSGARLAPTQVWPSNPFAAIERMAREERQKRARGRP